MLESLFLDRGSDNRRPTLLRKGHDGPRSRVVSGSMSDDNINKLFEKHGTQNIALNGIAEKAVAQGWNKEQAGAAQNRPIILVVLPGLRV